MCGIAGFHLKDPSWAKNHENVELFADMLLKGVELRGRQATGFMAITPDAEIVEIHKEPMNATEFIEIRKRIPVGVQTFLGHTRWATQGDNDKNYNLHPVIYGTCFTTHNGMISNDEELFTKHELSRHAEVDTEIISALLHKYGWDKSGEALHELLGSFAIAAVDPVRHKNKVLLAKGEGSPLFWHETPHFLVWASSQHAIREAWKEVLGTPPDFNNISRFDTGDMLFIDGDTVTPSTFEVGKRPFVSNPYQHVHEGERHERHMVGGSRSHPLIGRGRRISGSTPSGATHSTRGIVTDRHAEAFLVRAEGGGKARLWDKKDDYNREQMFKDLHGVLSWYECPSCKELIFGADFVPLWTEGKVCIDCFDIAIPPAKPLAIDTKTKKVLEEWCVKESIAHEQALNDVSTETGLSGTVVDYIIFRLSEKYSNEHPEMADIASILDDLYQEYLVNAWDNLLDDEAGAGLDLDEAFQQAMEGDKRGKLFEKCTKCRKFKSPTQACGPCKDAENSTKEAASKEAQKSETVAFDLCWCGKKATVHIGNIASFCQRHYDRCSVEGCLAGPFAGGKRLAEPGIANHLRADGKRVCHPCARGEKGVWSDKSIEQAGVVITSQVPGAFGKTTEIQEPGGL